MSKRNDVIVRRRNKRVYCLLLGVFVSVFSFSFLVQKSKVNDEARAADMGAFDAGFIISDYQMGRYDAMSEQEIQDFLWSKGRCYNTNFSNVGTRVDYFSDSTPPTTWHVSDGHTVCLAEENMNGESAAHIIWQAAQDYMINPQVLIVLLQKETGVITDPVPNSWDYQRATGYGCPDTDECSSKYYGFKNQVRNAAMLFRYVLDNGSRYYPVGNDYIQFNPNGGCGGTVVNVRNNATSALYQYTPYQPNTAALAAGYGYGDGCSAYGNRNFYAYFEDWFGGIHDESKSVRIPDGEYYIVNASMKDMAVDALSRSDASENVQLQELKKTSAQRWKIVYNTITDDYDVINVEFDKALDLFGGDVSNGSNIQLWEKNKSCSQRWKMLGAGGDNVKIMSTCSTKVIDVSGAVFKNGTNINLWMDNGTVAQKWELVPVYSLDEDGLYAIEAFSNTGKVLDISGGVVNAVNGTNIQLWSNNKTGAQRWSFVKGDDGYYTITNLQSGKILDVVAGLSENGTNLQVWRSNNSCAQKWRILKNSDGSYTLISVCSNKVVDLAGGSTGSGTNIQIYEANNTKAQKWNLRRITPLNDGTYSIASVLSDKKTIDITANQNYNGVNIQLYDANGTSAQEWKISYNRMTDYYTVTNPATNRALDVAAAGIHNGTNVQLWSKNNTCAQNWAFLEDGHGKYTIASACSYLALDVKNASTINGTNIWMWQRNDTMAQKWILNEKK